VGREQGRRHLVVVGEGVMAAGVEIQAGRCLVVVEEEPETETEGERSGWSQGGLGARRMSVAPGTVLYEPHTGAHNLYFIHRGQIRTYHVGHDNEGRLIDILGPDAWFGEASLAKQTTYGEQAIAVVPSVVSEIPAERFLSLLIQQPRAAIEVYRQLAAKYRGRYENRGLVDPPTVSFPYNGGEKI